MRHLFVLLTATAIGITQLHAQTPVTQLPNGRSISGWAVEVLPIQSDGGSARNRQRFNLGSLEGQMGIAMASVSAHEFFSESLSNDARPTAYRGKAFLRIKAPLRYAFVVSASANNNSANENCVLRLSVGDKALINGRFNSNGRYNRNPADPALLSGSTELEPGFYQIDFITFCDGRTRSQMRLQFSVRDEMTPIPRRFLADELFHVAR